MGESCFFIREMAGLICLMIATSCNLIWTMMRAMMRLDFWISGSKTTRAMIRHGSSEVTKTTSAMMRLDLWLDVLAFVVIAIGCGIAVVFHFLRLVALRLFAIVDFLSSATSW